ncbi:MAG: SDR family oxidoreductase [bacterium]
MTAADDTIAIRLFVTGASGFLGWRLTRQLERRFMVTGACRSTPVQFAKADTVQFDLRNRSSCRDIIRRVSPTHVIHAGAMTLTGECERHPELAREVNVDGARHLLNACECLPTPPFFLYVSTDLVFNGLKGNYSEEDPPDPVMTYGKTKLAAENLVRHYHGEWAIVRSALIYGPPGAPHPCFLDWMLEGIRKNEGALFTDEFRTPVFVDDLCTLLETIWIRRTTGLYHAGGIQRMSRYEFGLLAADVFGLSDANVRGCQSGCAALSSPRPPDVSLNIAKARRELGYSPRSCRAGLIAIFRQCH